MVTSIPGACAAVSALAMAGLPSDRFLFAGFLPVKDKARTETLEGLAGVAATLVFYETAPRLEKSLRAIAALWPDREVAVARELHELLARAARLGLGEGDILRYGADKAKISHQTLAELSDRPRGHLVLVTAINPTPAGEGKTTTTVGLGDGLNRIGKRATICIREASLGPNFGMKGGAAGGGHAQIVPMEEMNLHFTGDFHAITAAHNLLSAMIDNHLHHGNELDIDERTITWPRVLDVNDRALRHIVTGLGAKIDGVTRQASFDITPASELMVIMSLATDLSDLRRRLGRIVIGRSRGGEWISAEDLAVAVLDELEQPGADRHTTVAAAED